MIFFKLNNTSRTLRYYTLKSVQTSQPVTATLLCLSCYRVAFALFFFSFRAANDEHLSSMCLFCSTQRFTRACTTQQSTWNVSGRTKYYWQNYFKLITGYQNMKWSKMSECKHIIKNDSLCWTLLFLLNLQT